MSVRRICVREVDVITESESTVTAARRMNDRKVGTLVVVDRDSRPVGIVTDRDLAMRVLGAGKDGARNVIREAMTPAPKLVRETTAIEDALRMMRAGPFRRLP